VLRPPRSAKGRRHAPTRHDLGMEYAAQTICERKCLPPPTSPPPPAVPTRARGGRRFDRGAKGVAGGALESLVRATSSAVGVAHPPSRLPPTHSPTVTRGSAPGPRAPNDPRGARLRRRARCAPRDATWRRVETTKDTTRSLPHTPSKLPYKTGAHRFPAPCGPDAHLSPCLRSPPHPPLATRHRASSGLRALSLAAPPAAAPPLASHMQPPRHA
jgi:hypothetical protein